MCVLLRFTRLSDVYKLKKISKSLDSYIPEKTSGNTEIAKWLRPLAALPEFLGSIPSTHMLVHDDLFLGYPMLFSGL